MYSDTPSMSFVTSMGKKIFEACPSLTVFRVSMDMIASALESMAAAPTDMMRSF